MKYINRNEYLDFLKRHKDKNVIKVITGIRRSGKSTLFEIYKDYLKSQGVQDNQIISINFEDLEFEDYRDYKNLYKYITNKLNPNKMNYIFLDEIQHVKQFEKAVDSLFIKPNVDIYITGSNAYFMSGELATLLTGRYVELNVLPLSFKEFCQAYWESDRNINTVKPLSELYNLYITRSSFPYTASLNDEKDIKEYLRGIYDSVLLNDVVARYKISDVMLLESIVAFLFDSMGSLLSLKKIADTLTSKGRKTTFPTVEKYVKALIESMLIYQAKRYNIKGKELLATNSKYYVADIGLRQILMSKTTNDQGHILENIVYLELLRRGYDVYVGNIDNREVDFVARMGQSTEYYQVSASALDPATLERELTPFNKIKDNYPKYLLTFDEIGAGSDYEGVKQLNVLEWLVG